MAGPVIFAHKIIQQVAKQCGVAGLTEDDYLTIRVMFRSQGGNWQELAQGDIHHMKLLKDIVKAWVKNTPKSKGLV